MVSMYLPTVSDLRADGTRIVNVYDSKTDTRKNIRVTAQEADEFLSSRQETMKKAKRKSWLAILLPASLSLVGILGAKSKGTWPVIAMVTGCVGSFAGALLTDPDITDKKISAEFIAKYGEKEEILPENVTAQPTFKGRASNYINLTDKYSQEEIVEILKQVGAYKESPYPANYEVKLFKSGALVINNKNNTNDTTEILKDGSVVHAGSWHNKEVAPVGSFTNLLEEAQAKLG